MYHPPLDLLHNADRTGIPIPEPPKDFTVLESLSSTGTENESPHDL